MSIVRPDELRLTLEDGQHYVIVKAELNYGETIAMYAQMRGPDGGADPLKVGSALVVAYLLDWSLTDNDGRILSVREQPPDVVTAALNHLPYDEGQAVVAAIRAHDTALIAAREEKKRPSGAPTSAASSRLHAVATGATNG